MGEDRPRTWTDDAGVTHRAAGPDARILSLVPSLTELAFDLGLGRRMVGRTAFCTEPRGRVETVKVVGGTKTVKMAKVRGVRPSHALVNVDETPKDLAQSLADAGIEVIVTHPIAVADNVGLYRLLGGVFGAEARARALAHSFEAAHRPLTGARAGRRVRRVLYLIWKQPWMTVSADTYIARMLDLIGWRAGAGAAGVRYPEIALDDEFLNDVDLVLFSSEPFAFTDAHVAEFGAAFPSHAAKARLVDGKLLGWYGSRAVEGLKYLEQLAASEA